MKVILASIRVILIVVNTAFQITLLLIDNGINGGTVERSFKHRRRWARWSLKILGIVLEEIDGALVQKPVLVISNHRTLLDPVIQAAYIDAFIIAKAEVSSLPVISQGASMTGIIFVKREKLRSRLAARESAKKVLESGQNVLVYAEGTTGTNRLSEKFKPGTFAIASELNIPVVPITIEYRDKKDYWHSQSLKNQIIDQIGILNTYVKLRIGSPIEPKENLKLMKETKSIIDRNLIEMQTNWSKVFPEFNIKK